MACLWLAASSLPTEFGIMGPALSAYDKGRCQLPSKPHHMGRRLAHEGAHSGRRNFKPKIPSESKDNYLGAFSGDSSARTG